MLCGKMPTDLWKVLAFKRRTSDDRCLLKVSTFYTFMEPFPIFICALNVSIQTLLLSSTCHGSVYQFASAVIQCVLDTLESKLYSMYY